MKVVVVILSILLWNCDCLIKVKVQNKDVDVGELGKNITETIRKPSGDIDVLIGDIYRYYEALQVIHNEMKKGVAEAMKAFYQLRGLGGPPFLHLVPVDEKPLEDFYKWKKYHGIEFRGFLKYNEDEWNEMNEFANKSTKALGSEK
uniref:Uncharacterized protein n=1 Tax=Graphocephala atropunctata TaxID=36148 RepID=A0A1B6KVR0_9HEMI